MEIENILISICSLFFVLDILYVYYKRGGFFLFGIFNIFLLFYIVFIYIGSLILLFKLDSFSTEILDMTNDKTLRMIVFLTTIFFLFAIIGAFLADFIFSIKKHDIIKWIKKDIISFLPYNDELLIFPIILSFLVGIVVFVYYLSKIPLIPLLGIFLGISPMKLRAEAIGDLFEGGKIWWYKYFYLNIPVFLSFIIFVKNLSQDNYKWRLINFLIIIYCIFVNIFDVQKAPLLFYVFFLFIIYYYIHKRTLKIHFKKIVIYTTILFSLLIIMYIYFMGRDFKTAFIEGLHRTFTGQLQGLYGIIENFSNRPLYGRTLPPFILKLFNMEFYDLDKEMKLYVHKYINPNSPIIGLAPTVYFGEVYANFGLIACFLSMFLIPFFLRLIDNIMIKKISKNSISTGLYFYLMWYYKNLVLGRLSPFIFDTSIIVILTVYFYFFLYKNLIKILFRQRRRLYG